jgi:hypothetical protein
MQNPIQPRPFLRLANAFLPFGRNKGLVAAWLLALLLASSLLWAWALSTVAREKSAIRQELNAAAVVQVKSYADQLERSLEQIDYIMLSMKYYWQETRRALNLEKQVRAGLVPTSSGLILTIVDRQGRPVSSTMPLSKEAPNIAEKDYFRTHQADSGKGLLISGPVMGLRTGVPKLILSRRARRQLRWPGARGARSGLPGVLQSSIPDASRRFHLAAQARWQLHRGPDRGSLARRCADVGCLSETALDAGRAAR